MKKNLLVPRHHDIIIVNQVNVMFPDLNLQKRKFIIVCMRNSYASKGLVFNSFKKCDFITAIFTYQDIFTACVAHHRHRYTEYENELKIYGEANKKDFNRHYVIGLIFEKYYKYIMPDE